jgi:hypothetical protein
MRTDVWYETSPGDNVPPRVASVGYLAYDNRFLYAGFEFQDPDPHRIRAPLGDRDTVVSSDTDYAGVILDTRNDGKTGILLLANPRGIQYDAVSDDVTNMEDSSPDFFWSSAARITERGWVLEIAIPFSSLRYGQADPQTWGIMLYRNYPRDRRYQFFSTTLPRGGNCFVCRANRFEQRHGGHGSGVPGSGTIEGKAEPGHRLDEPPPQISHRPRRVEKQSDGRDPGGAGFGGRGNRVQRDAADGKDGHPDGLRDARQRVEAGRPMAARLRAGREDRAEDQVVGSLGFGRKFEQMDNGVLREGAIKDIGAAVDFILDLDRDAARGCAGAVGRRALRRQHRSPPCT